jgi:hypothetical protein
VNTYSGIAEKSMDKFAALVSSFRYPGPRASGLRAPLKDVKNTLSVRYAALEPFFRDLKLLRKLSMIGLLTGDSTVLLRINIYFYAMLISAADLFSKLQNKAHSDAQQRKQV